MPLVVENRGKGFIGPVGEGWRISYTGSPVTVGDGAGRLGSISFSATCDETTKFTIDNYVSIQHLYDNQTDQFLSSFDGYIRSVQTDGRIGQFGMVSQLSAIDVDRTCAVDVSGTYQRSVKMPVGLTYVISGTTYYTGGYWTSIGPDNVFIEVATSIYAVAAYDNFIYVLAAGSHNGEVVYVFYVDGQFREVWPVYSDATDIAAPNSRHIAVDGTGVWVGQQQAKRVKLFSFHGVFSLQFGTSGSADGQFNTVSGLAVSLDFNSVFVTDSILGRIQRFNKSGTYQNKWGTWGTGAGNTVFNNPSIVAVDDATDDVFVVDDNARVRTYDSFGNYQAQVMGSYDFVASASTGEYTAGRSIGVGFDSRGNGYGFQDGRVYKYVRTTNISSAEWSNGSLRLRGWEAKNIATAGYTYVFAVDNRKGSMVIGRNQNYIEIYSGSLGDIYTHITHYVALAAPDFPIWFGSLNQTHATGAYAYPGWRGNVWEMLCDLMAATSNAVTAFGSQLLFLNREDKSLRIPDDAIIEPLRLDSRGAGRSVRAINLNARNSAGSGGIEVMYTARADNNRVFSAALESISYVTVNQDTYPEFLLDPVAGTTPSDGVYTVWDSNDVLVDPVQWANYGGKVRATVGTNPGDILLTIYGPGFAIPATEPPYRIASGENSSLTVLGRGVITVPEIIQVGTGVSEQVSNALVAKTLDSPFLMDATDSYTETAWAAYNAGTPQQRFTISFRRNGGPAWVDDFSTGTKAGTYQFINSIVVYKDAEYIVEDVDATASMITLSVYRYSQCGHVNAITAWQSARFEEMWVGRTAAEFEAYWAGYTAQDFLIAPNRNPFGINARND